MKPSAVSFKSNICLISGQEYTRLPKEEAVQVTYAYGSPMDEGKKIYTENVRTCTAGGLKNDSCMRGFHFYPSGWQKNNLDFYLEVLLKDLENSDGEGILLGGKSKSDHKFSIPVFEKVEESILNKSKKISIFKDHFYKHSETNLFYSHKNDTWFLNCVKLDWRTKKSYCISTLREFLKFFKEISIAPTDRLFVEGREILKKECPKIFRLK